jgi:two-component system response regulator FlrC
MISNVRIAVVDDDKLIRDFLVNALMFCVNREVLGFDNGSSAWDYVQVHDDVDILVSDVNIPGMSGLELLSRIRRKRPTIVCVIMSGDPAAEKHARQLGANAFLAKPFRLKDVFHIVEKFVVEGSRETL